MNTLFIEIVKNSIVFSIIALVFLLARPFIKKHLNVKLRYFIWMLLLLKLIMPFSLELPQRFYDSINSMQIDSEVLTPDRESQKSRINKKILGENYYTLVQKSSSFCTNAAVLFMYFSGIICLLVAVLVRNLRSWSLLKNSLLPVIDQNILGLYTEIKNETGCSKSVPLYHSPNIFAPLLYGLFNPSIILSSKMIGLLSDKEIRHILHHELIHFIRRDLMVNSVMVFLQVIYWFNPVLHYAFFVIRRERELVCDYILLSSMNDDERLSYGQTILQATALNIKKFKSTLSLAAVSGNNLLKERIIEIINFPEIHKHPGLIFCTAVLLLTFSLASFVQLSPPNQPAIMNLTSGTVIEVNLDEYFENYHGCFILYDIEDQHYYVSNKQIAEKRTSPYSTFKLISSLYALKEGVIDPDHLKKWDGTIYEYQSWHRDHTFDTALQNSVNWYFEKMHSDIGYDKLFTFMKQIHYGNQKIGKSDPHFWYNGTLLISPYEQVKVLQQLVLDDRFSDHFIRISKVLSNNTNLTISGKTGSGLDISNNYEGWYLGWLNKRGRHYIFVTYVHDKSKLTGKTAKEITVKILSSDILSLSL